MNKKGFVICQDLAPNFLNTAQTANAKIVSDFVCAENVIRRWSSNYRKEVIEMADTEKGRMAVLKEHELLMNADLIERVPELREYADKVRNAFRAKGLDLDERMNLKTTMTLSPARGIKIPIPDPGGVCKEGCMAWSGGPGHCGGCTNCVGPCVDCVAWVDGQGTSCGTCSDCIKWT